MCRNTVYRVAAGLSLVAENRQGAVNTSGEVLLRVDGRNILVKGN